MSSPQPANCPLPSTVVVSTVDNMLPLVRTSTGPTHYVHVLPAYEARFGNDPTALKAAIDARDARAFGADFALVRDIVYDDFELELLSSDDESDFSSVVNLDYCSDCREDLSSSDESTLKSGLFFGDLDPPDLDDSCQEDSAQVPEDVPQLRKVPCTAPVSKGSQAVRLASKVDARSSLRANLGPILFLAQTALLVAVLTFVVPRTYEEYAYGICRSQHFPAHLFCALALLAGVSTLLLTVALGYALDVVAIAREFTRVMTALTPFAVWHGAVYTLVLYAFCESVRSLTVPTTIGWGFMVYACWYTYSLEPFPPHFRLLAHILPPYVAIMAAFIRAFASDFSESVTWPAIIFGSALYAPALYVFVTKGTILPHSFLISALYFSMSIKEFPWWGHLHLPISVLCWAAFYSERAYVVLGPHAKRFYVALPAWLTTEATIKDLPNRRVKDGSLLFHPIDDAVLKLNSSTRWHLKWLFMSAFGITAIFGALFWPIIALCYIALGSVWLMAKYIPTLIYVRSLLNKRAWKFHLKSDGTIAVPEGWNIVIQVVALAITFWRNRDDKVALTALVTYLVTHYGLLDATINALHRLASKLISQFGTQVRSTLPDIQFGDSQVDESVLKGWDPSTILTAFGVFVVVLGVALGVAPKLMSSYSPPQDVHTLAGQIRDFKTLSEFGWPLLKRAVNDISAKFFPNSSPLLPAVHQNLLDRYSLLKPRIAKYQAPHPEPWNADEAKDLAVVKSELWSLYEEASTENAPVGFAILVRAALLVVSNKLDDAETTLLGGIRRQPLGIIITGEGGTGKSGIGEMLRHHLLPKADIWMANMQAKHDDGYIDQKIVQWDEAFNPATDEDFVTQAVKILQVNSTSPIPSLQSEAPKKGRHLFKMLINLYTTNKEVPEIEQIMSYGGVIPSAWQRRFPWILRLSTIRVGLQKIDLDYKDLECYSFALKVWRKISIDDFINTSRILLEASDMAYHKQKTCDYSRVITPSNLYCSLSGSNYDILTPAFRGPREAQPPTMQQFTPPKPPSWPSPSGSSTPEPSLGIPISKSIPPNIDVASLKMAPGDKEVDIVAVARFRIDRALANSKPWPLNRAASDTIFPELYTWLIRHKHLIVLGLIPDGPCITGMPNPAEQLQVLLTMHEMKKIPSPVPPVQSSKDPPQVHLHWGNYRESLNTYLESKMSMNEFVVMMRAYCAVHELSVHEVSYTQVLDAYQEAVHQRWKVIKEADRSSLLSLAKSHPILFGLIATAGALSIGGAMYAAWAAYVRNLDESELKGYDSETKLPQGPKQVVVTRAKNAGVHVVFAPNTDSSVIKATPLSSTQLLRPDPNGEELANSIEIHQSAVVHHVRSGRHINTVFATARKSSNPGHWLQSDWRADDEVRLHFPATGFAQSFQLSALKITSFYVDAAGNLIDDQTPMPSDGSVPTYVDAMTIKWPDHFNARREIRRHIMRAEQTPLIGLGKVLITGYYKSPSASTLTKFRAAFEIVPGRTTTIQRGSMRYVNGDTVCVAGYVPEGVCGSACIVLNPNMRQKYFGFVSAGNKDFTYITIVREEWFDEEEAAVPLVVGDETAGPITLKCGPGSMIETHGRVKKPFSTRYYGGSSLTPAPWNTWACLDHDEPHICGFHKCPNTPKFPFPPAYAPFQLNGVRIDPVLESLFKAKNHPMANPDVNGEPLLTFMGPLLEEFGRVAVKPALAGVPLVLSRSQAINGVYRADGQVLVPMMNMKTGVGLPLSSIPVESIDETGDLIAGKYGHTICTVHGNIGNCPSHLVGAPTCRTYDLCPSAMALYFADLSELYAGRCPIWLAQLTQKPDEPRDAEKFARLLSVLPYHAGVILRQYFAGPLSAMSVEWLDGPFQIALNAHCRDAHDWHSSRSAFGSSADCGDLSEADLRFQHAAQEALVLPQLRGIVLAHWKFAPGEFESYFKIATLAFRSATTAYIVWGHWLFTMFSRLATGVPMTTQLNSFGYAGARFAAWCYHTWTVDGVVPTLSQYLATFKLAGVGDDYSNVVVHGYEGSYNMQKLAVLLDQLFSMRLTDPYKSPVIPEFIALGAAPFVRRVPSYHGGHWHLGLELRSRLRPMFYVQSTGVVELRNVAESVLIEHYEAGDRVRFDEHREQFRRYLSDAGMMWSPPLWRDLDRTWQRVGLRLTIHDVSALEVTDVSELKAQTIDQVDAPPTDVKPVQTAALTAHNVVPNALDIYRAPTLGDVFGARHMPKPFTSGFVFDREMDGGSFTWTTGNAHYTGLYSKNLPYDIVSPNVAFGNAFYGIPFAKFDMAMTFKCNCPPNFIGFLMVNFRPCLEKGDTFYSTTAFNIAQFNTFLVPAAMLNDIQIEFPYSFARKFFTLNKMTATTDLDSFGIGAVNIFVWEPLLAQQGTAPTSLTCDVYWRLTNLTASAGDPGIAVPMSSSVAEHNARRALLTMRDGSAVRAAARLTDFAKMVDSSVLKSGNWRQVDKANNPDVSRHVYEKRSRKKKAPPAPHFGIKDEDIPLPGPAAPSQEAAAKTQSVVAPPSVGGGVVGAIGNTLLGVLNQVGQTAVGLAPHIGEIAKGAGLFAALFDKPLDERPPSSMISVAGTPMNASRTLMNAAPLNPLFSANVANFANERWTFPSLARMPGPAFRNTITNATAVGIFRTIPLDCTRLCDWTRTGAGPYNYVKNHTRLSYISQLHAYVAGDVDFLLVCLSAPTTSFNLRIAYIPGGDGSTTIAAPRTTGGDYVSEVYEVRGYREIPFRVPLTTNRGLLPTGSLIGASSTQAAIGGYVFYILETPVVSQDLTVTPTAYITTILAGGPNIQFVGYLGWSNRHMNLVSLPESVIADQVHLDRTMHHDSSELKCSIADCFDQEFPPLGGLQTVVTANLCAPPMETDLVQLMKRPSYIGTAAAAWSVHNFFGQTSSHWRLVCMFKYQRGSLVHTVIAPGHVWAQVSPRYNDPSAFFVSGADRQKAADYGAVMFDLTKSMQYSVQVPYVSRDFYQNARFDGAADTLGTFDEMWAEFLQDAYANTIYYTAAGDDYGLHIHYGPPQETFSNAGITLASGEVLECCLHSETAGKPDEQMPFNRPLTSSERREVARAFQSSEKST